MKRNDISVIKDQVGSSFDPNENRDRLDPVQNRTIQSGPSLPVVDPTKANLRIVAVSPQSKVGDLKFSSCMIRKSGIKKQTERRKETANTVSGEGES